MCVRIFRRLLDALDMAFSWILYLAGGAGLVVTLWLRLKLRRPRRSRGRPAR